MKQTDLNFATAEQLRNALAVDAPTAGRVIAQRPYLQVQDLLVIEGIGPERLKAILASSKLCATPPTTPPPSAEACVDDKVDLQSAGQAQLVSRLGISTAAAGRIASARPFATMRHVSPERVPGVGKGTLDFVIARSCLTPSPVRAATTSWRWAYRSQRTVLSRDEAQLEVPSGVVDGPGAWASITEASSPLPIDGPTADFHIWGAWTGGGDAVRVTLPLSPDQAVLPSQLFTPVLLHITGPGDLDIAHGGAVTVAGGSVSTWTRSLSLYVSGPFGVPMLRNMDPLVTRTDTTIAAMRAVTGTGADPPSCTASFAPWRATTLGSAILEDSVMDRPPLRWCVGDGDGDSARWTFANNTGAVLSFNAQGASRIVDMRPSGNLLLDATYDVWNATTGVPEDTSRVQGDIPPGAALTLQAPAGTIDDRVGVGTNEAFALPTFLLKNIGMLLPEGNVNDLQASLNDCGYAIGVSGFPFEISASQLINAFNCAKTLALTGGKTVIKAALGTGLVLAHGAITVIDTLRVSNGGPWDLQLTYRRIPRPAPPGQPTDGFIPPAGAAGVRLLKFQGSIVSYVLDAADVAHHVNDGNTYECNARFMKTQFEIPADGLATVAPGGIGDDATCPTGEQRSLFGKQPGEPLHPQAQTNVLLRRADGKAWLVNALGQKAPLIGVGSFDCFASQYLVWDLVTADELEAFQNEPSVAGRACF